MLSGLFYYTTSEQWVTQYITHSSPGVTPHPSSYVCLRCILVTLFHTHEGWPFRQKGWPFTCEGLATNKYDSVPPTCCDKLDA